MGALAALAVLTLPAGARAAGASVPPSAADGAALLMAERWMVDVQDHGDGGMPINGLAQRHRVNLWAALGLAAAGINAQDQAKTPNSRTLFGLLRTFSANHELTDTSDLALYLLAAHAVGFTGIHGEQDPGAPDTVADLVAAQLPGTSSDRGAFPSQPGATTGDPLSTAYAALALSSVVGLPLSYAEAAAGWLIAHQNIDGSWGAVPGGPGDVETTATILEALASVPDPDGPAVSHGASWLGTHQGDDGGWSRDAAGGATPSDVPATAAVVRSVVAQGTNNPYDYTNGLGNSPMSFLRAAQTANGTVGRAPGVPADEPTQTTAVAMLAFGGVGLVFGPIPGGADNGELPDQRPPAGLPSGPLLPTETVAPKTDTPVSTSPPATTPPRPAILPFAAPATTTPSHDGVKRVKARKRKPSTPTDDAVPEAGAGSGGNGTLATPGAPDRAGGGGGVATGTFRAPAATSGAAVPLAGRSGGIRAKAGVTTDREVRGTLLGRQAATEGARGSSSAAAGALGSQSGGATAPWWAIGLALAIAAGVLGGIRLDRRRPEVAL